MRTKEQIIDEARLLADALAPHDGNLHLRTLRTLASLISDLAVLALDRPTRKRK